MIDITERNAGKEFAVIFKCVRCKTEIWARISDVTIKASKECGARICDIELPPKWKDAPYSPSDTLYCPDCWSDFEKFLKEGRDKIAFKKINDEKINKEAKENEGK